MNTKVLLITPPFSQLNTPYPATAYLKGYLDSKKISVAQKDLGIDVTLQLFSSKGLDKIFSSIAILDSLSENSRRIFFLKDEYISTIDIVIEFLQGKNDMLAHIICNENLLPQASRFNISEDTEWAFGSMGIRDKAKYYCTLYLEDISDFIVENIDSHFGFSRYAERISSSASHFDSIYNELHKKDSLIIEIQNNLFKTYIEQTKPDLVGISIPFPGNLFAALKCGQFIKKQFPEINITIGGGYPNTELRSLNDSRIFEFTDFITLDDGEVPLLEIINYLENKITINQLKRTFVNINNSVTYINNSKSIDFTYRENIAPSYTGLNPDKYLSVLEMANPMHRLWSDGFWNKLTMAHGCYWARCSFCDTTLDYIKRFEPTSAKTLCDKVEKIIQETGKNGFHFVDEAAPPALMIAFAKEILKRKLKIVWWTNIRFEKSFTSDVCILLKESGCIAVSGGLEVASDRILSLINKGVSVSKVAKVCDNFTQAGIMTHAYLMYGFPTQTEQETIDSLEVVRQLFVNNVLKSGFWHQFALTAHSPVGNNPLKYQIIVENQDTNPFANNDLYHKDPKGANHHLFSEGLKKSLFNFMHEIGLDFPLQEWFNFRVPKTSIPSNYIKKCINDTDDEILQPNSKVIWLHSSIPFVSKYNKNIKGKSVPMCKIVFHSKDNIIALNIKEKLGTWITDILSQTSIISENTVSLSQLEDSFIENNLGDFDIFINSHTFSLLKNNGLLII